MNRHVYVDRIRNALDTYCDRPCLHIKRAGKYDSWTYGDLRRDLCRCTDVLVKRGVEKGINCAVIGENSPEWIIAYHAVILTGGCTVPIDPNLPVAAAVKQKRKKTSKTLEIAYDSSALNAAVILAIV